MVGKRAVLVLRPTKALWCDLTQATSSQHVKKDQKDFLCGTSEQPVSIFCMGSILSQRVDAVALTTVDMLTLEGLQDLNVGRRCWPCSSEAREQIARFFFLSYMSYLASAAPCFTCYSSTVSAVSKRLSFCSHTPYLSA